MSPSAVVCFTDVFLIVCEGLWHRQINRISFQINEHYDEYWQFGTGFSLCIEIGENSKYIEHYQQYPLNTNTIYFTN